MGLSQESCTRFYTGLTQNLTINLHGKNSRTFGDILLDDLNESSKSFCSRRNSQTKHRLLKTNPKQNNFLNGLTCNQTNSYKIHFTQEIIHHG